MRDMETLVKMAQKGDTEAFTDLISLYKENLYKIAFVYLKNEQDALDIISDTVYKAYMNIKKINNPSFFKTWITRILINSATDKLKDNKNIIYIDDYQKLDNFNDSEEETDIDTSFDLFNAVDKLDIKFKNIIILKYFQDMTISEISTLLAIPEGTVKVYLHRGLKKLKLDLVEECV
ncbi:MAG TPA: sigma-70 family RNA polymerase sigma factor [Clostridiaceae bacterium]